MLHDPEMKLEMKNVICIIWCPSSDAFSYEIHMRVLYEDEPELTVLLRAIILCRTVEY